MSAGFSALVEVVSFPSNGCFLQWHTSCDFCSFSEYLYVVWCLFTVNWWLLCSVSIGRSNSPTTLCHQSRNWMAGSWSSVEWILWHLHWCNCCSVSVKTWLLPTTGEYEGLQFDYLWGLMSVCCRPSVSFCCCVLQWKYWASWTHSCWKSESNPDLCLFHAFFLYFWWVLNAVGEYICCLVVCRELNCFDQMGQFLDAGKFGGILAAIPQPIVAAILCITFGMVGKCNSW